MRHPLGTPTRVKPWRRDRSQDWEGATCSILQLTYGSIIGRDGSVPPSLDQVTFNGLLTQRPASLKAMEALYQHNATLILSHEDRSFQT